MKSVFKSDEDFNQFFDNEYYDKLTEYYESYRNERKKAIISKSIFGGILSFFFIVIMIVIELNKYVNGYVWVIDIVALICIVVGVYLSIYNELKKDMKELNDEIIKDIIVFISDSSQEKVEFSPDCRVSRDSLNESNLFNLGLVEFNGKNFIKVPYHKNTLVFSDLYTYVYKDIEKDGVKTKKKKYIFDGIYIGATMNKKNKNQIYLIPNNIGDKFIQSRIKSYIHYSGHDINLENAEFMKKYKVFCDDEIQARYILSMSLMERINKVDELFKQKKYIVFREGKRFTMCIEGVSIEKIRNIALPAFQNKEKERAALLKIFNELNNLFKIYHILDLGNDLYTKYNTEDFIKNPDKFVEKAIVQEMATISFKANDEE